jgi:hypothetical protein
MALFTSRAKLSKARLGSAPRAIRISGSITIMVPAGVQAFSLLPVAKKLLETATGERCSPVAMRFYS